MDLQGRNTDKKPNLFLLGFQKCGSSALFELLCRHSQIHGAVPKETFYLTDKEYEYYSESLNINNPRSSWSSFYKDAPNDTVYLLEASVCNFYQETAMRYLKEHPSAKVIFIVRDPVERFISNYKYYSSNIPIIDSDISIEEYFELINKRAFKEDSLKYALEHGKYSSYIEEWEKILGNDRIHIVGLKPLLASPQETMMQVFRFLEIDDELVGILERVNESKTFASKNLHRFLVKYMQWDFPLKNKLKKIYYDKFSKRRELFISNDFRDRIKEIYEKEYRLYSQYF